MSAQTRKDALVIKEAKIHAASYVKKASYWIVNLRSVDAYEFGFWQDDGDVLEVEE